MGYITITNIFYITCHLHSMVLALPSMQLTIMEYIKHFDLDITRQGILWRINHSLPLLYVDKIERIGKSYVFTVKE